MDEAVVQDRARAAEPPAVGLPAEQVRSLADAATVAAASPVESKRTEKLHALTSLRFVAAALVVVVHCGGHFGIDPNIAYPFRFGQAVSFFFVLSGFILTYVYPSLAEIGVGRFLWARFARIWPAHVVGIALGLLLAPILWKGGRTVPGAVVANVLMTQTWVSLDGNGDFYPSINPPSWSISTEFGFYLCFVVLISRWPRTWWWKLAATAALAAGMVALCWHLYPATSLSQVGWTMNDLVYMHPLARLFEFTLGMTTALLWRRWAGAVRHGVKPMLGTSIEIAALAFAALAMGNTMAIATRAADVSWIGPYGAAWLINGGIPCVAYACLIGVMACETGWISRLLGLKPLVVLGEISYSVYLIHFTLILFHDDHQRAFANMDPRLVLAGFWVTLLLTSHLVWRFIERPCRTGLVKLSPAKRTNGRTAKTKFHERECSRHQSKWRRRRLWPRVALAAEVALLIAICGGVYYAISVQPR